MNPSFLPMATFYALIALASLGLLVLAGTGKLNANPHMVLETKVIFLVMLTLLCMLSIISFIFKDADLSAPEHSGQTVTEVGAK